MLPSMSVSLESEANRKTGKAHARVGEARGLQTRRHPMQLARITMNRFVASMFTALWVLAVSPAVRADDECAVDMALATAKAMYKDADKQCDRLAGNAPD